RSKRDWSSDVCSSDLLFEEQGWQAPSTWDELMALSVQIKAAGMYPWAFTGMHANYFHEGVLQPLVAKFGGQEVWKNVDNLEDGRSEERRVGKGWRRPW